MSIFEQNGKPDQGGQQEQQPSPAAPVDHSAAFADQLAQIKNDSGEPKYASVEKALEGLQHSQQYIASLLEDKAKLEEEIGKRASVADALSELTQRQDPETPPVAGLSEEDVAKLVQNHLSAAEKASTEKANASQVASKLQELYGDKAEETFNAKAQELGMTAEAMGALAKQSPQAVIKLFGGDSRSGGPMATPGTNTTNINLPNETLIKRNETTYVGGDSQALRNESKAAADMVGELHEQGLTTWDLSDPKTYKKYFG